MDHSKTEQHNKVEKKRKDAINQWIENLSNIVPTVDLTKDSKHMRLEKAYKYIKELEDKNRNLILATTPQTQGNIFELIIERIFSC